MMDWCWYSRAGMGMEMEWYGNEGLDCGLRLNAGGGELCATTARDWIRVEWMD